MSLISRIVKSAAPLPHVEEFDRYLFIGPHPDDLEIGAGATAAKLASMGKKVCFLICVDGRYGTSNVDISPDEMIGVREAESTESAKRLGINDIRFLGLCDGGFYDYEDLLKGVAKVIGDFKPDFIFAPDPDVTSECHIDHLNVGNAAKRIAYFAPYYNLMERYGAEPSDVKAIGFYFTARPNRYVKVRGYLERQLSSLLECFPSQIPEGCEDAKSFTTYIKLRYCYYGAKEAFRVLGRTHMHCLSEAELF